MCANFSTPCKIVVSLWKQRAIYTWFFSKQHLRLRTTIANKSHTKKGKSNKSQNFTEEKKKKQLLFFFISFVAGNYFFISLCSQNRSTHLQFNFKHFDRFFNIFFFKMPAYIYFFVIFYLKIKVVEKRPTDNDEQRTPTEIFWENFETNQQQHTSSPLILAWPSSQPTNHHRKSYSKYQRQVKHKNTNIFKLNKNNEEVQRRRKAQIWKRNEPISIRFVMKKKSFVKNGYGYEKTRTKDSKGKNNFMMSSCYIQMYVCGYVWWAST